MDMFQKECPVCKGVQIYSCEKSLRNAIRQGRICRHCAVKASHCNSPRTFFQMAQYKEKMSASLKNVRKSDSYGGRFKQKCRENKLLQIQKQGIQRTFNERACKFMDMINDKFGIHLQHGRNGGEVNVIGYSLDGYDSSRKIVFEYDEPKHHIKIHKRKDIIRQERIISALNPSAFWRYDEKESRLIDVLKGEEILCQLQ